MNQLNRTAILQQLLDKQRKLVYEHNLDEDEGAAEHYGELHALIDVVVLNASDEEVRKAAESFGVSL